MFLIIRPTGRCNFKCDFCRTSQLQESKSELTIQDCISLIDQYHPSQINIEGGEPLMMPPSFFIDLIEYIDKYHREIELSMTSNLWDWYKRPEKWDKVFKHPDFEICTSFQYGDKRKISDDLIFTEDLFIDVYNKFHKAYPNKELSFISVIDYDNQDTCIKTALLAKRLGTTCKLTSCDYGGRSDHEYPFDQMMLRYAEIIQAGLGQYESNCKKLIQFVKTKSINNCCPFIGYDCYNRFVYVGNDKQINHCSRPSKITYKKNMISTNCITCDNFKICNGCYNNVDSMISQSLERRNQYCQNITKAINMIKTYVFK